MIEVIFSGCGEKAAAAALTELLIFFLALCYASSVLQS